VTRASVRAARRRASRRAAPVRVASLRAAPSELSRIAELVTGELGIMLPANKLPILQGRVQRRMYALGITSLSAYASLLFAPQSGDERRELLDAATTNKTDFFREPSHFTQLRQVVLPHLTPHPGARAPLCKLWCAGCSTGQEVYTLAMVLSEHAREQGPLDFGILGTDVCTRVLEQARAATYAEELVEPVPLPLRQRYLLRSKQKTQRLVRFVKPLRARASFAHLNFMDERYPLPRDFDVVFFRNVLIYFDRPTQQRVLARICEHLRPGGHLYVGHSESLNGLSLPLTPCGDAVFQKQP
jgi:chemotaxis protein methyltransferase CheR